MMLLSSLVEPNRDVHLTPMELLVEDRAWLETEFAAIMNASGFGDRLIVGTDPRPWHRYLVPPSTGETRYSSGTDGLDTATSTARVRSPPGE